jgi:hypothetical protein
LLLLSSERIAGSHADIALSMESAQARFTGTPALLEELETRAVLVRHRTAPVDQTASVLLSSDPSSSSVPAEPAHESAPESEAKPEAKPSPDPEVTPHESAA